MASQFRYTFRSKAPSAPSVIRLWFGKAFFIWKVKALHAGVENISIDIDRRLRNGIKNPETDIYTQVIERIKKARVTMMEVEVVFQTEDPEALLLYEYDLLVSSMSDALCLNTQLEPYVPAWIPQPALAAFRAKIAARNKPRKSKARNTAKTGSSRQQAGKGTAARTSASHEAPVKSGKVSASKAPVAKSKPKAYKVFGQETQALPIGGRRANGAIKKGGKV
jgi:hypothetical protein